MPSNQVQALGPMPEDELPPQQALATRLELPAKRLDSRPQQLPSRIISEAVVGAQFTDAAREAFRHLSATHVKCQRRPLYINTAGGVGEISNPDSAYRRALLAHGALPMLLLLVTVLLGMMNCFELVYPNVQVLVKMFRSHERPKEWMKAFSLTMAFYELFGLGVILVRIVHSSCRAAGPPSFEKWDHLALVAWHWLPLLARFSAIKSLGRIHPKIVFQDLQNTMVKYQAENPDTRLCCLSQGACMAILLTLKKVVFLLAGIAALVVKIKYVASVLDEEPEALWRKLVQVQTVLAFINQCVHIIDVTQILKKEALHFAFAGEDAVYQRKELVFVAVFRASLAQGLWEHIGKAQGKLRAFAALFAFSHTDVQRLTLCEGWAAERPGA